MESEEKETYVEKRYFYFTVFLLALFMAASVMTCMFITDSKIQKFNDSIKDVSIPVIETSDEKTYYEVKEYNGKIGVFENGSMVYTLDVYVFTLPEGDKKLLSVGIRADSQEELYRILEEYY